MILYVLYDIPSMKRRGHRLIKVNDAFCFVVFVPYRMCILGCLVLNVGDCMFYPWLCRLGLSWAIHLRIVKAYMVLTGIHPMELCPGPETR